MLKCCITENFSFSVIHFFGCYIMVVIICISFYLFDKVEGLLINIQKRVFGAYLPDFAS